MIIAVILGLVAGVIGFSPLLIGLNMTKKVTATSNFGHMSILIISLIISFAIMFAAAIICATVARDVALFFVLAEAIALSIVAIVFGFKRIGGKGKERQSK